MRVLLLFQLQGDFAEGQRTIPLRFFHQRRVGTFAS
jgi:hypothetical protein